VKRISFLYLLIMLIASCGSTNVNEHYQKDRSSNPIEKRHFLFNFEDESTISPVLEKAKAQKKLIYLDVSASWCLPCQLMKRDVYTDKQTADFFNKNFINYLVDVESDEGPDIKVIFDVKQLPTLLILNEQGDVLKRHEGAYYQEDLIRFASELINN